MSKKLTTEEFIEKAKLIHGDRYDYSLVEYTGNKNKIRILCKEHGVFLQTPSNHLNSHICVYCSGLNKKSNTEFIKELKIKHGNKYDYSLVEYNGNKKDILIICKEHGNFKQSAITHLRGSICPKCNIVLQSKTNEWFITKCKLIHHNRYDYSNTLYKNARTNVDIICKIHGVFSQNSRSHLNGKGCPVCKNSKGELYIINYLNKNNIIYNFQKTFDDCKNVNSLPFDFYLPELNICIEFNGRQHYEPVSIFGGKNGFELQKIRDNIKKEYCHNNNILLITIKFDEDIKYILDDHLIGYPSLPNASVNIK